MSLLTEEVSKQTHALDVFTRIEALLLQCRDDGHFWAECVSVCASLARTSVVACFEATQDSLRRIAQSDGLDEFSAEASEVFNLQAASLCQRLMQFDKHFLFEPAKSNIAGISQPYLLALQLYSEGHEVYFLTFVLERQDKADFNELVVRLQLVRHFYQSFQYRKQRDDANSKVLDESFLYVLEILDKVVGKDKFNLAAMTLVNELAHKLNCEKVCLGRLEQDYIKTVAISHLEEFDKNSRAVLEQEVLFEEAADQELLIQLPRSRLLDQSEQKASITQAHEKHKVSAALSQLLTLPVILDDEVVFCLTIERHQGELSPKQVDLIAVVMQQLAPWLQKMHYQDLWLPAKLKVKLHDHVRWWMGPKNTLLKALAAVLSLLLLLSMIIQLDHEVETTANLETDNIAYLFAPFDGYIKNVKVHAGDRVSQDQVLLSLDKDELLIKALEQEANIIRFKSEADKARSRKKLVDMKISLAQISQSKSELERINYYLERADLRSPFDGIVVDGDREELLGSPVSKGALLIKVANPTDLYVQMKLAEQDIDWIKVGQTGQLKLISRPEMSFLMTIEKIVPVAVVDGSEGNIFWVKAKLNADVETWWRPGMSGVAHITVGEKSVLWLTLHRSLDALRMALWI